MLRKSLRVIVNLLIATICGVAFGGVMQGLVSSMISKSLLGSRDFVVFWATGQQLVHHANPYDPATLLQIERGVGFSSDYAVMYMRNLPTALPLVYPLGWLGLQAASIAWTVLLLGCLYFSVLMLWKMHGRPRNSRHWLGYSFGPALISAIAGQTSLFALLGLVLFLRLHRTRPFAAGLSLWLCMLKPQLFLPFGLALLAWIVVTRGYRLLLGTATALAASCVLTYLIDPMAWTQYLQMVRRSGIESEFIPCLSGLLRNWISPGSVWLQSVPAIVACGWAVRYYWRRRLEWDWQRQGSMLMILGLMTAPYAWVYDACVLIPALLEGAYATRSRTVLLTLALLSALVEVALGANLFHRTAFYYWTLWTWPAWLAWYLWACRNASTRPKTAAQGA